MGGWTLDDIPWHRFDPAKVDPDLVRIAKAASLVEHNGAAYAHHLCLIFADDPEWPFSFVNACAAVGIDVARLRGELGAWLAIAPRAGRE